MFTAGGSWLTDISTAKTTAQQQHKLILLNFSGSDWCAPCIKMKKEVFESEAFLTEANEHLVLVRADFPRQKKNQLPREQTQHNEALAELYNPDGKFPFTLLLDADGKVIKTWDGYVFASQDKFMAELTQVLNQR
jgi:thioredoxin-related protein